MDNFTERFDEEQFISKQELLGTMYISNSQLYRWKRMGLIPQEWFIKQITCTGQRTVFPRKQIIDRVHDILKYKEEQSLYNIGKILSPETDSGLFSLSDIRGIEEIDRSVFELFDKNSFTYPEILILIILTDFRRKFVNDCAFCEMAQSLINAKLSSQIWVITFVEYKDEYLTIITEGNACLFTDSRQKKLAEYSLYDVSAYVVKKYGRLIRKDRNKLTDKAVEELLHDLGG